MLTLVISIWSALGDNAGLIALAVVSAAIIWLYIATSLTIEVNDKELRVGKAHIHLSYIGQCVDLDAQAIRQARTRDADPQAFLAIRFWASKGVKIAINDARDQTPYWLISSNRGAELIKALKN